MSWEGGPARVSTLLVSVLVALSWGSPAAAAKIACVGDSITYGYGLGDPTTESYPAVLQSILGSEHTVENFGVSGCTALRQGDKPYWNESAYTTSTSFAPDLVIILLGTNDAKPQNWQHQTEFAMDYGALVEHYQMLGARVYVAIPAPVFGAGAFDISPQILAEQVVPLVRQAAVERDAPQIDLFAALSGQAALFPDTVHPNAEGARWIAETVAAALERDGMGSAGAGGAGGVSGVGAAGGGAGGGGQAAVGGGLVSGGSGGDFPVGGTGFATGAATSSGGSSGSGSATPSNGGGGGVSTTGGVATTTGGASAASGGIGPIGGRSSGGLLPGGGTATSGGTSAPTVTGGVLGTGLGGSDLKSPSGESGENEGCGCRVNRQAPEGGSLLLAATLFFFLRCRRRRILACATGKH